MTPTLTKVKEKSIFALFRRQRTVREIFVSAKDIQENLDWVVNQQVPLSITTESSPEPLETRLVGLDHSPLDAYIVLRSMEPEGAMAVLGGKDSLLLEYASKRGGHYSFHSYPLSAKESESGDLKAGYPASIESLQDFSSVRFKHAQRETVQVDVERQRGVIIDIGFRGLKFTSNQIFEKGQMLGDLEVDLPRYGRIQGTALVKHVQPSKDYPTWRYFCGVEFAEMKPRDQRKLNRYLSRMLVHG